jgi:glycosyltransferase involved in cell wall biosynthesis
MINSLPLVSVIIPTHNRRGFLRRTLDALETQTFPLKQVEVIVVADGCTDDTVEILHHYRGSFTLRVLEQSCRGPAAARNRGSAYASGELLIFLDDDIEAGPSLIEAHVNAHECRPGYVGIGYLPLHPTGRTDFFSIELRIWWEAMFHIMRQPGHRYTYRDLLSGNFSIETKLFNTMGGFDPAFWCHEDYEFGVRLIKAGISFIFASDAIGYHHEITDLGRSLQRKYDEGRADVLLGRRHPDLLPVLPLARFVLPSSSPSRLRRHLAFQWSSAGRVMVGGLRQTLRLLEMVRFRGYWRWILNMLLDYFYWLGVAEELHTEQSVTDFLQECLVHENESAPEAEIDLCKGLEAAERLLDAKRPAGAQIRYGQQWVGRIPSQSGAERLRGTHLRPILANQLARPLFKALALEGAIDLNVDSSQVLAACYL